MTPELDAQIHFSFNYYKGLGFLVSLVLLVVLQILFPNRLGIKALLKNWKVNVPLALINVALLALICGACASALAVSVRQDSGGAFEMLGLSYPLQVVLTVLLLDLVAYLWHRANHVWGVLWRFHVVHHSDATFDTSTAVRFHGGELLISLGVRLLVVLVFGLPVLGLILFELVYGFFNLLVHSDVRLPEPLDCRLSLVFVTPSLHLIHHSQNREEHNRNYGTIFSFWDRALGSYLRPVSGASVRVGLMETAADLPLRDLLLLPFRRRARGAAREDK